MARNQKPRPLMPSLNVRVDVEQLQYLNGRAESEDVTVSQLVRDAIDSLRGEPSDHRLSSIEVDRSIGADDRVEVVVKLVNGQAFAAAFDCDQARRVARELLEAADRERVR